jgi:5-(carboxyamino)imidazole ribonucleotide mutase
MKAQVGIIMGSDSDLGVMEEAAKILGEAGVPYEIKIVSAHRTPRFMQRYALQAEKRGLRVIIAGAGGAAHLPGMVASLTRLPVIGIPIQIGKLKGIDALLSIAQMPRGVPVATMAVDGGANGGLTAVRILALNNSRLKSWLRNFRGRQVAKVKKANRRLKRR